MKFNFVKYKLKTIIIDLIIFIILFVLIFAPHLQDSNIAFLYSLMGVIIFIRILYDWCLMINFFIHHSKEEIKHFEAELSNVLLKYESCFLTQEYIFDVDTFKYIRYADIICVTLDSYAIASGPNGAKKKQIIYLKNNKKYVIRTWLLANSSAFAKIIKEKNADVFFGSIKEYKKYKAVIEHTREIKERTIVK